MPLLHLTRLTALGALAAGLLAQPAAAAPAPLAADFSDASYFFSGNFNNVGWSFSVTTDVTVNGLGLFDFGADGLVGPHQVGLWSSGGQLLAQATVDDGATAYASAAAGGQWLFADIAALQLTAGNYVIGASYADDDADPIAAIANGFEIDSRLAYIDSRASDGASFDMPGAYGQVEPGIFGPNMRLASATPTPLSEPGHLLMLPAALAAAAFARRRRA